MKTFPLKSINMEEAKEKQFKLVDIITRHMSGKEALNLGDLGVSKEINRPEKTKIVEEILAEYFGSEACMLVRGAGTNALRWGFLTVLKPNSALLVHDAPIYPTTEVNIDSMGLNIIRINLICLILYCRCQATSSVF